MPLEPAIPDHLRVERTFPLQGEEGFQPKTKSYSARFAVDMKDFAICFFGVQSRIAPDLMPVVDRIKATVRSGPCSFLDEGRFVDHRGFDTTIVATYWKSREVFRAWMKAQPDGWWREGLSEGGSVGAFYEAFTPDIVDVETSYSHCVKEGVAHLSDHFSNPTDSHEYWGSARDRIPRGQTDALEPAGEPRLVDLGSGLLKVVPHGNLTLIRSGQDWEDTVDKERKYFLSGIQPALNKGMKEIETEGLAFGCYFNRVLWLVCESGEKTYSLSAWHSMDALSRWAKDNKNHKAIFASRTTGYQAALGDRETSDIKTGHEVMVVNAENQEFIYFNCHSDTGMLRAAKGIPEGKG